MKGLSGKRCRQMIQASGLAVLTSMLLLGVVVGCRVEAQSRQFDVQILFETADLVARHGDEMESLGKMMVEHGKSAGNQTWIADGEHWQSDASNLKQLSKMVKNVATDLQGNPTKAKEVNIRQVIANGQTILAEGKAVAEHGKVMIELSSVMLRHAREYSDPRFLEDAEVAVGRSKDFVDAGDRVTGAGQALIDFGEDMLRSIGGR